MLFAVVLAAGATVFFGIALGCGLAGVLVFLTATGAA